VILTLPIFQYIGPSRTFITWPKDAGFAPSAPWIIPLASALKGHENAKERAMPELAISTDDVAYLIVKAREFDVKEANSDPDSGSNATDDNMIDVLEDNGCDPVANEIAGFINSLTDEEQIDLVALMRLGRGDATIEEWDDLRREVAEERDRRTARYLLGEPLLGDYLADGLAAFGLTWVDEETPPES
jgi:hypothetical protein